METKPNLPAFPQQETFDDLSGLTKREYFAVMVMQGFIASYTGEQNHPDPDYAADEAVKYADALIEELNKE